MVTELSIYISLGIAAVLLTLAARLGISLYQSN